jgi:hypothetical protein
LRGLGYLLVMGMPDAEPPQPVIDVDTYLRYVGRRLTTPAPNRAFWEWTDDAGGFLRASNWTAPGGVVAIDAQLQACSNAQLTYATEGTANMSPFSPTAAQYHLVTDLAVLVFATAAGNNVQVVVPGPLATTFGATSNIVNPLDPTTAALIAAVIGTLSDVNGNLVTAYVSGVKSSRRTEQNG